MPKWRYSSIRVFLASASIPIDAITLPFSLGADPPLAPVTVWSYEGRGDWIHASGPTLSLSLFRPNVHDEIVFVTSSTAAGYVQNIPRTRRLGLETTTGISLGTNFPLDGSYSWINATYQSDATLASALKDNDIATGDQFALSPHHRARLSLHAYRHWIVDGTLTARAVSENPKGDYGSGDTDSNRIERLLTPAYPSTVTLKLTLHR